MYRVLRDHPRITVGVTSSGIHQASDLEKTRFNRTHNHDILLSVDVGPPSVKEGDALSDGELHGTGVRVRGDGGGGGGVGADAGGVADDGNVEGKHQTAWLPASGKFATLDVGGGRSEDTRDDAVLHENTATPVEPPVRGRERTLKEWRGQGDTRYARLFSFVCSLGVCWPDRGM